MPGSDPRRTLGPTTLVLLALVVGALPGCVSRQLTIRSEPPGARVMLGDRVVGTTPYRSEFVSYGTRRVQLDLPGHQRVVTRVELERPWWQVTPLDLFVDLLLPIPLDSHFAFDFALDPHRPEANTYEQAQALFKEMRQRADALRAEVAATHGQLEPVREDVREDRAEDVPEDVPEDVVEEAPEDVDQDLPDVEQPNEING